MFTVTNRRKYKLELRFYFKLKNFTPLDLSFINEVRKSVFWTNDCYCHVINGFAGTKFVVVVKDDLKSVSAKSVVAFCFTSIDVD